MCKFCQLFIDHYQELTKLSMEILGSYHDAQDNVQETFEKCTIKLHTVKDKRYLKRWIYTSCKNNAINKRKKENHYSKLLFNNKEFFITPNYWQTTPFYWFYLLDELKEDYSLFIDLYHHGLTYKELEKKYNTNQNTLKCRIHRAKKSLCKKDYY